MQITDGNKTDTTNLISESYLQINSSGFQNVLTECMIVRKKGRYDFHIVLLNSGQAEVLHNGEMYTLKPGNLVIYLPGEEQKYTFQPGTSTLWCHFTGTIANELLKSCNLSCGVYELKPNKRIYESFSNLVQRFHQPGKAIYSNAALLELVYSIGEAVNSLCENEKSSVLLRILTYINANYDKQLTLEQLAKMSGYSKSRFSHIFTEVTGTTPIQYLTKIRLKISCEILTSTRLTIAETAYSSGFNDPLYYSRIFKKTYGMSPRSYRALSID